MHSKNLTHLKICLNGMISLTNLDLTLIHQTKQICEIQLHRPTNSYRKAASKRHRTESIIVFFLNIHILFLTLDIGLYLILGCDTLE